MTAARLCRQLLAREPRHPRGLALMGDIAQREGRNNSAVKMLRQALSLQPNLIEAHDAIALAYQALGRREDAVRHFAQSIELGLGGVEALVKASPVVSAPLLRMAGAWPRRLPLAELLGEASLAELANDALLLALLEYKLVADIELEFFLTTVRKALLDSVLNAADGEAPDWDLRLPCALSQQCFVNEYVFACEESETVRARQLRDRVAAAASSGAEISPHELVVAAMYAPLSDLPEANAILMRPWPDVMVRVLTQQIREPAEDRDNFRTIPNLTPVSDEASRQVQRQYDEHPYPRWTTLAAVNATTLSGYLQEKIGAAPPGMTARAVTDILVAGCGTGAHAIETAMRFPHARVLAVDISRVSLAFAARRTREMGVGNVQYARADILKLGALDRRFDVIETVGVLHHLENPSEGWGILQSLLKPGGVMLVGVFGQLGRKTVNKMRAHVAARGYLPTSDSIRACRQEFIKRGMAIKSADFFSTSGCRALWFNAVERQFTIPQIQDLIVRHRCRFLGFETDPEMRAIFEQRYPAAATDLDCWHDFERTRPWAFEASYTFWVQPKPVGPVVV